MNTDELMKLKDLYKSKQRAFRKMHLFQVICLQKLKTLKIVEVEDELYEGVGVAELYGALNIRLLKAKSKMELLGGVVKDINSSEKLLNIVKRFNIDTIDYDLPQATDVLKKSLSTHFKKGFILDRTLDDVEQTIYVLDSLYASSIMVLQNCLNSIDLIIGNENINCF